MLKKQIYEHKNGEWGYRFKAKNGRILCRSEGYDSKSNAERALTTFIDTYMTNKTEIYEHTTSEYAYRIKSKNGEILCWSEGYVSKSNAKKGLLTFLSHLDVHVNKEYEIINYKH